MKKKYYLDVNAHCHLNPKALQAYVDFCNSEAAYGHPSSLTEPGRAAAAALEESREKIANLIGAKNSNQIIFTSGCTNAAEWAMQIFLSIDSNESIAISPVEHTAVKNAFEKHYDKNINKYLLPIDCNGIIQPQKEYDKIICIHMQNETGVISPIENKAKYIFSDMSQSLGKIDINVTNLNIDIAIFGAHKFGASGNFGFIYLKNIDHWKRFESGSGYYMDRPGTPDVAGAVVTAAALEDAIQTLSARQKNMTAFQNALEIKLKNAGLKIIGEGASRSPNTTFVGGLRFAQNTLLELSNMGIYVSLGSACGAYYTNISPLIRALGLNYTVNNVMRISQWGEYSAKDGEYVAEQILRIDQRT